MLLTEGGSPGYFEEAKEAIDKKEWLHVMKDDMKSFEEDTTFDLMTLLKAKRALKNTWIYILKQEGNTSKPRYKAILFVKSFSQKTRVYIDEIFLTLVKIFLIQSHVGVSCKP